MESVLSQEATRFVDMVDALALERLQTRYTFMDAEEHKLLLHSDPSEGMRIYWNEMLESVHITAVTAILRSRLWLSGVFSATADQNLLAFSAAFRGFMESAADATTALIGVPLTLAQNHATITASLSSRSKEISISKELERELIHFSHARYIKKSEQFDTPSSHKARSARDYMTVLGDRNAEDLESCYRILSDLTHPAAPTTSMWLTPVDAHGSEIMLSSNQGETIISGFLQQYETLFIELTMTAFNTPVLVLNTLNYFSIRKLHTPPLLSWHLDGIPASGKCKTALDSNGATPQVSIH